MTWARARCDARRRPGPSGRRMVLQRAAMAPDVDWERQPEHGLAPAPDLEQEPELPAQAERAERELESQARPAGVPPRV